MALLARRDGDQSVLEATLYGAIIGVILGGLVLLLGWLSCRGNKLGDQLRKGAKVAEDIDKRRDELRQEVVAARDAAQDRLNDARTASTDAAQTRDWVVYQYGRARRPSSERRWPARMTFRRACCQDSLAANRAGYPDSGGALTVSGYPTEEPVTAPDPSAAPGPPSFAQCRQAARLVRRAEHGKQVIGWLRPRSIDGLSRQHPPLAVLLSLLGRQNLLVWHSPEQFVALRPPDPHPGSGAPTAVRWHWLIRWWEVLVPWVPVLAVLVTVMPVALAATLLPAGSALPGLLLPALALIVLATLIYPAIFYLALLVHGLWWLVRRITRPASRSLATTSPLIEQNWSMMLCHLTDPDQIEKFLRAARGRAHQLDSAQQPTGQRDASGWLVWDERCITTSAARDAVDSMSGVTRIPATKLRVLRLSVPAQDDESAPRVEVPRPDAVRIVGFLWLFNLAWCACLAPMVANVERAACEPRCADRPVSYGEALYWLLSHLFLRGEPGKLAATTTETRIIGLTATVAGVGLLGLTVLALIRSWQERSKSVQDLQAAVRNSLDVSARAALGSVFINYRQGLADLAVASLRKELAARLGPDKVFYDLRSIPPGTPYPAELRAKLEASTVLLAVIAHNWLTRLRERENTPGPDWVRYEISTALRSGKTVIPVLFDGAALLSAAELPDDLAELALLQVCPLRSTSFDEDLTRLVGVAESALRLRN